MQIAAALIVVVLAIGLYKAKTDAARTEARVRQLQTEIAETEADLRALRADIARQETPAHVELLAKQHLGLATGGEVLPEASMTQSLPAPQPGQRH